MERFRRYAVLVVIFVIVIIGSGAQETLAWVQLGEWATHIAYFDAYTLTSTWVSIVDYGRNQWINVTPSPFDWLRNDGSDNDILYTPVDGVGNYFATTTVYLIAGTNTITRIIMRFDSAENWYTGTGYPGANQPDARSLASHEFGHASGLTHTQGVYCPGNSFDATMCANQAPGKTHARTLASDDINGLNAIYPP